MIVAIIPARGGSVRIENKNYKDFCGKPIINYSIEAAKKTGLFDKIIVSTDSPEISEVAVKAGAEVPFLRPKDISGNHIPTAPVLEHALDYLSQKVSEVKYVCCIYPTSVMVRSEDISKAFDVLLEKNAPEVFAITTFDFPIFRGMEINEAGHTVFIWPENELRRSQDLKQAYHDAGLFYWFDAKSFMQSKTLYNTEALGYVIPNHLVCDIDEPEDWQRAEIAYEICKKQKLL